VTGVFAQAVTTLSKADRILVFSGAGISTESGIPDFRGPDGLWTKMDPDDFTIHRYLADPEIRRRGWRLHQRGELWGARSRVKPNPAHHAVVSLWKMGRLAGCVTQNVDGLHQLAGLPDQAVAELHGNVRKARCLTCHRTWPIEEILRRVDHGEDDPSCHHCGGVLKSATVLFGELLPEGEVEKAWRMAEDADAALVVGSTLSVYPAADLPLSVASRGRPMVIINLGPTEHDRLATVKLEGKAGESLPRLVEAITR
jgi:NAD-dependent deacetylase